MSKKQINVPLVIRALQIRATLIFHLTSVRMFKINETNDNFSWEWGILFTAGGNTNWYSHYVNQWGLLRKMGIVLLQDLAIPLLYTIQRTL